MENLDNAVKENETIKITLEYRGKTYSSTMRFTETVISVEGYPKAHIREVKNAACRCMREALVAEGLVK